MIPASSQVKRLPAVADQFYPADAIRLKKMLNDFLTQVDVDTSSAEKIKALIVPHAGYIYSAAIAASAYKLLSQNPDEYKQVILLGPSHRLSFKGLAISSADCYSMPFGDIKINNKLNKKINTLPQVVKRDDAHLQEHSLEVQLPFLQTLLKEFSLLPLVVGDCKADEVSEVLELLWDEPNTLFIISSDLSHYLPYQTAIEMDKNTALAIVEMQPEKINYEHACGRNPINGFLLSADKHSLRAQLLDLRNSGDTAGLHDRVVGYGAFVFTEQK